MDSSPQESLTETLCASFLFPILPRTPNIIILCFISRVMLGNQYRSLSSSLFSFLLFSVTFFLLGPNVFPSNLFSDTLSSRSSLQMPHQVRHTVHMGDNSVGVATRHGLDGPGIESRWGVRLSSPIQTGCGARLTSCTKGTWSFSGVKRPGRGVDHPPLSEAEIKERVELYLFPVNLQCVFLSNFNLPLTLQFAGVTASHVVYLDSRRLFLVRKR